jgi:hypothetical protein
MKSKSTLLGAAVLLAAALALAAIVSVHAAGSAAGFTPLFDGKTLTGWAVKGGVATYRVEDGAIVGRTVEGSKNTFLCTTRDYADFVFECEVRCDPDLNSGIQIRSHTYTQPTASGVAGGKAAKKMREAGEVYGYQCEITTADKCASGNFWDEARQAKWLDEIKGRPGACTAFKDGQWNHYRIVAQGDRIRSWVNGVLCADFRDTMDKAGFIGLQVHSIAKGKGPFEVRWRNLKIRELKPDEKVD